ncbi:MAG: hypothetical protein HYR85_24740 [Planctomycetes bacterium]|nr:hypothetical protein [Planctomycetota bacterium]MBI3846710.1 hypothetical protein [Planctomycetota bacterium]
MIKSRLDELVAKFGDMGYRFKSFTMAEEGDYAVDDASWNYKDIIHLKYVHHLVDAYPSLVTQEVLATLYHQRVLGMRLPLTLVNYIPEANRQTYHTSFFFFVIIVETHFEALGPLRTRVVTEYALGAKPFLLALFFPLFRWSIKHNYKDLMKGDVAMRERRGELRRWGYDFFHDPGERGFWECSTLERMNVIVPTRRPTPELARIPLAMIPHGAMLKVGESDHYGLQLTLRDGRVEAFARLCLHEGSCLDVESRPASGAIECPWHGLLAPPLASLPIGGKPAIVETKWHRFELTSGELVIQFRETSPSSAPTKHATAS